MRILLFLVIASLSTTAFAQNKVIVFVCEHGSAKSVIAATYFNKLANERNLQWEAITRGIDPDKNLSANTAKGLLSDGLQPENTVPQKLTQRDFTRAEKVVLFNPLPDSFNVKTNLQYWLGLPAVSEDYTKARSEIVRKVTELLDSL